MRRVSLAMLLVACSASPSIPPPTLPEVPSQGGAVMAHPRIVTITFAGDPDRAALEAHAAWAVGPRWLPVVGAEYGLGEGSVLAAVERTETAPATTTHDDVITMLTTGLDDGSIPLPGDGDLGSVLYVVHYPLGAVITDDGATSCTDFLGYHGSFRRHGREVIYAVVVACALSPTSTSVLSGVERRERTAAHELFEAATDPRPRSNPAFQLRDPNDEWRALGNELSDLCEPLGDANLFRDGAFVAPRVWSNRVAAALDGDPCVPAPSRTFFDVEVTPARVIRAMPGTDVPLLLTGWSVGAVAPWNVALFGLGATGDLVSVRPARPTPMANHGALAAGVTIGSSVPMGTTLRVAVAVFHDAGDAHVVPITILTDPPCGTHTTCDTCATRGCGWCIATGRCELAGAEGSAETDCGGADWAPWLGACEGFCDPHATCSACAAQPGCGWCEGRGCLGAGGNGSRSLDGACSGAAWSFTPDDCPT